MPRLLRNIAIGVFLVLLANEGCVASHANDLAGTVPVQETFEGLANLWPQYQSLAGHSMLGGWGVKHLEGALTSQTLLLAERVMANYRAKQPTVREGDWQDARDALRRAITLAPSDKTLRGSLSYCEGQLHRINGEAAKSRNEPKAHGEITAAIGLFREAATLRPNWPDPFLGLARAFIYGEEDVDNGANALATAEKLGHAPSERETLQLADGFRARGETLLRTATTLKGMPQERDYLTRANQAFHEALTRYAAVASFGNTAANLRDTQKRIDRIDERLAEMDRNAGGSSWD